MFVKKQVQVDPNVSASILNALKIYSIKLY